MIVSKKAVYSKENIAKLIVEAQAKGYKNGYKKAIQEVYDDMFLIMKFLIFPSIYNVKDDKKMSNKYLVEIEPKIIDEIERLVCENFKGDLQTAADCLNNRIKGSSVDTIETSNDRADFLINQVNALRKKLGAKELE